ncbi:MAG TPA: hypothetical protein H9881_01110 [Candidatus Stackebrandtia excrementipullorum]|nr:hypothetical protein [Candidatus Stackebrandtia excrementipullorum]
MSLPTPVLDLASDVVPDAEDQGKLAFAYAYGPLLNGFGGDDELGLVCVWDHDVVPDGVPAKAEHMTQREFDAAVSTVAEGRVWQASERKSLTDVAAFAYGVLLSDDEGAGTAARGTVGDFPVALAQTTGRRLAVEAGRVDRLLVDEPDRWLRADILSTALYGAYVAWFSAHERYFPGARWRAEYARYFEFDVAVLELEDALWRADGPGETADCYRKFTELILNDL